MISGMIAGLEMLERDEPNRLAGLRLSESNHRIANNLAMLAGLVRLYGADFARQRQSFTSAEVKIFFSDIAARIDAVGRLHRLLSAAPAHRDVVFGPYLRDLCKDLASLCTSGRVSVALDLDEDCRLSFDQAAPLCLIVSEVVTNAIKYAFPGGADGCISVSLSQTATNHILITIADDGIGLPDGFDPAVDGGLGLRLVHMLCQQLDATCAFQSQAPGLLFRLEVPARIPLY